MFTESQFTLIAGAGPTGLTLARDLQRRGVPFRLIEKSDGLQDGSRGKGIQPRTQEVLDDLGLLDEFRTLGADYPPMLIHRPDGATMTHRLDEIHEPTPEAPYPNLLMMPQWRTCALLAEGVPIEFGVGLASFTEDADGVHATLDTGEVVTARYLVAADGGRSTVRRQLGVPFEGETHEEERLFIADVRVDGLDRSSWHIWPSADGLRLGLCPLPSTDDFQLTSPVDGDPAALVAAVDPALRVTHVGWTSQYRANMRLVSRYRVGNVFLAGDAAHVHSPAGGQGLNTGVQDAYNLGWKIATGSSEILDSYEAERLPVAAGVLGITTRLHQRHVDGDDDAMRRDDPVLKQLSLNYRGAELSWERRPSLAPSAIRAGDRVPLLDLLRGPQASLLAVGWTGELPTPTATLHVHHLPAGSLSAEGPTLFLVRPDGYVGCATRELQDALDYAKLIAAA